jgi:hypothetical protein
MSMIWIVLALGLGATVLLVLLSLRQRVDSTELGNVSTQWLAEQRAQDRDFQNR